MLVAGIFGLKASKPDLDSLGIFTSILITLKLIYILALSFFLFIGGIFFFNIPKCDPPAENCKADQDYFIAMAVACGIFSVIILVILATILSSLWNSIKLKELLIKQMALLV